MADLSWVDTLSESEAGAILKFKTNGIDSLSEEEAGLLLPHVGKLKQKEAPPPEPTPVADYLSNSFKNITGGLTGVADVAMGLPKMALSIPTAAIKTAMGGDPGQERVDAQNAAESLFGTPSKILNQMGVPADYLDQNAGHKSIMYPFEKIGEGIEALGDRAGDKYKAGVTKQALDIATLGLPIPGAKLAGKAAKTVFDPFVSARKPADFNAIKAGDVSKMTSEETSLYDGVKAVENGKSFRKAAAEQMKQEEITQSKYSPEDLIGVDEQMQQRPQDLQAPQFGMGGKLAKVEDQIGREKPKFEPGERATQESMDLEQQRLARDTVDEASQKAADTEAAYANREFRGQSADEIWNAREQRQAILDAPLEMEPSQGSSAIEGMSNDRTTYRPNSQRGSLDVGAILDSLEQVFDDIKPKTLDEFILAAKQAGIQASESVYETMFTGKQGEAKALQTVQSGQGVQAFGKRVSPTLERFMSPWKDRTSAEVIDIIKNLPDNNATDLGIISGNVQSKGRLGVQRHANEGVQAGVAYMTQLYENAKIEGNQLLNNAQTGVSAIARKLETLTGEGKAFEVFKQIFEHQLDPDNHQFHLDNSQKALLDSIKKTTDKIWDDFVEQVQKISPEKAERLAKMKQDYYIPHQFFGDFISYVRDADGRLVTYVAERTERGAKAAIEHLKQELGSEYQFDTPVYVGDKSRQLGKKAEAGRIGVNMQEGMAGQFDYMIDLLSSDDVHVQRAQRAVQSVLNRHAMSSEGMTNRTKINTNVGGFFGKKGWKSDRDNYFDAKDSFERYVNGFHEWKGNMQVADFLNDIKDNAPDKINTYATLKNEFEAKVNPSGTLDFPQLGKAFANVTGFSPKEVTNGARGLSSFITLNALGFANPVMILQNFVQSPITQAIQAANLYGHGANFNPASVLGNILISSWDGLRNGATNPKWQKYAFEHEIGDPGLVTTHGKTKAGSAIKEYTAAKSVTASEQVSRIGYFYGMTKTLIDSGYPEAKALEIAKNMTRDHMGNYENYAKPGAMTQLGIAGELAGRLQTYGVNAFTQFSQAAADMFKGIKEGNPRLLVPFAMFIASQYLAGGMNGTIPMDVAEKLHWGAVKSGMIPPDMRSPRQYLLEEHPNVAVSPLSRATGVWTEGSFRANVPLLSAPVPQKMVEMAKELPATVKWILDIADPQNRVSHLDKARVLEVFLPTAIRGTIEKKYLVNNNNVMVSKGTGRPMYKMGPEDAGVTSYTNLRSYNRGLTSEISNLATQREMAISEKKKALEKSFNEKLSGVVGHGQKLSPQYVTETIKKDFSYGGDIDKTMERALKFATEAGYSNQLVLGIINSEKNAFKMQRMSKSYKALQENSQ